MRASHIRPSHGHVHLEHANHAHGHGHAHAPKDFGRAFKIGITLNIAFVLVETVFGVLGDSVALLADAGHNVSDVLSLMVAWAAASLSNRAPSARFTYGLRNSSILAALLNAALLMVATGAIVWEAINRFFESHAVAGVTVMVVAAVGIVVNGLTAWLFASGRKGDVNVRSAFLHMASDAAVSAGVVVAGLLILVTGAQWIDAAVSLAIAAMILWSGWDLMRETVDLALQAVPRGIDPAQVRLYLLGLPGVEGLHDLHIWPLSTTETAMTGHLLMPDGHPGDPFLMDVALHLNAQFNISHTTLQIETGRDTRCALEPDHVI